VGFPEDLEQFFERNFFGIEFDLDHFSVTGFSGADLLVSGIGGVAAGIAGNDGGDALHMFKNSFNTPETAAAQGGNLGFGGSGFGFGFGFRRSIHGHGKSNQGEAEAETEFPGRNSGTELFKEVTGCVHK
jgi:hypothetical protein